MKKKVQTFGLFITLWGWEAKKTARQKFTKRANMVKMGRKREKLVKVGIYLYLFHPRRIDDFCQKII